MFMFSLQKIFNPSVPKERGGSVNGEVIAGGDEFLLNISLINVDVSYVISATKIEPITF